MLGFGLDEFVYLLIYLFIYLNIKQFGFLLFIYLNSHAFTE